MKVASWNVRGWRAEGKKSMIKNFIMGENIDILGLVETKHVEVSQWEINKCWATQDVEWVHAPALNGSGGLIVSWHKDAFEAISTFIGQRWICVLGTFAMENFRCAVCVVYAPNDQGGRRLLWGQLRNLRDKLSLPLIMVGDFNEVARIEERKDATQFTTSMRDFSDFIQDTQLFDLEIGQKYTWMRKNSASRIDRALVTMDVVNQFQNLRARCSKRWLSDHFPIVISTEEVQWGPSPFRTLDVWLEEPKFLAIFKQEWVQLSAMTFEQKLREMKKPLRKWNREVFGNIDTKISAYQKELEKMDMKAQSEELMEIEWSRREAIQSQLRLWMLRKERYWKQLSRCKILKEGDKNTRYFHLMASMRKRKKLLSTITVRGRRETEPGQIRRVIVDYFKELYKTTTIDHLELSHLRLSRLTEMKSKELEKKVTLEEIKEAFLSCDPTKAPGYDGFNLRCLKHVWPVIGEEFSRCILNFFATGKLPNSVNITWVTLIPKKKDAVDLKDFRPISTVGSIYKVIAKILSRRLREVMLDLIGTAQTAFVKGRQILDGALIANETVAWLKKYKKAGVILKLDFQKAYDTINWGSLDLVMAEMGFGQKWRSWIMECVSTARMSIIVNGKPSKPFQMGRGLRQGDPLSPFLFVIMAEVLNRILMQAE